MGFIPTSTKDISNVFTVIWKVKENINNPILGIQLLKYLENLKGVNTVFSVGINKNTLKIFEHLNIYTNKLRQYVLINRDISKFQIAKINDLKPSRCESKILKNYKITELKNKTDFDDFNFLEYKENIPYKTKDYFVKRYLDHPIYIYNIYGVFFKKKLISLYFTRLQSHKNSKVIRIVDFIGKEKTIFPFADFISRLINTKNYEYADFYCFGLDYKMIEDSGFELVHIDNENLIIPNYFQPFLKKNISIYFFSNTKNISNIKIFKGDGDQDRPS